MDLERLQMLWIERFKDMEEDSSIDPDRLAAPFLSVAPSAYMPGRRQGILYIGKATGGAWYRPDFEKNRSLNERREKTARFLQEVESGEYKSAFWSLARTLGALTSPVAGKPFDNIIWSNIAKIGVTSGNPPPRYLNLQADLARETLISEISFYRPALIVFVSGDYAECIVRAVLKHFDADQNDLSWNKDYSDLWWRPACNMFPSVVCASHPQGKTRDTLKRWVRIARELGRFT